MKMCPACGESKSPEDYGKASRCKPCNAAYVRARRAENPERQREINNRWTANNPDKVRERNCKSYAADLEAGRARSTAWRGANPDKVKEQSRRAIETKKEERAASNQKWFAENKERRRAYRKAKYEENREAELAKSRAYKLANKESVAAQSAAKAKANPAQRRFYQSMRRAAEKRATPIWVDHTEIRRRFDWAELLTDEFGQPFHVDHVVPLTSKTVCGLHWHGNLAVIPATENQAKSNRRWPDMPEGA